MREQELAYLEWSDISEQDKVLRVQGKDEYGFKVKDSEQREIPIPDDLLEELIARKSEHRKHKLVLGTATGEPNSKLLRALKRLTKRAELNCNRCEGCNGKQKECREWTLHRFRRTFGTTLLRAGLDLRSVQALMGQYLRPATGTQLRNPYQLAAVGRLGSSLRWRRLTNSAY